MTEEGKLTLCDGSYEDWHKGTIPEEFIEAVV